MTQNTSAHKTTLNICEAVFDQTEAEVCYCDYTEETFRVWKEDSRYYAHRGSDRIFVWALNPSDTGGLDALPTTVINFRNQTPVFAKFLEQALVARLRTLNYSVFSYKKLNAWETQISKEHPVSFGALTLQPRLRFAVHCLFSPETKSPVMALSLRRHYRPLFTKGEDAIRSELADTRDLDRDAAGAISGSPLNVRRYLEATGQNDQYRERLHELQNAEREYLFIEDSVTKIRNQCDKLYIPGGIAISDFCLFNLPNATLRPTRIQKPRYFFFNERTKKGYYNKVLSELGPYSLDRFRNQTLNILAVSPSHHEGSVGEYLSRLKTHLYEMFHIQSVTFRHESFGPDSSYEDALSSVDIGYYNLAIISVSEQDKTKPIDRSPYHISKAKCLNQRVPTQEITIEKIRNPHWAIENDLALNVYTKLGGTAWTIEKTDKEITELVVGVGATVSRGGDWRIGFANIFDHNGSYIVGDCDYLAAEESYRVQLRNHVRRLLESALEAKRIDKSEKVRLVFHLFKEAGGATEVGAIDDALGAFHDYNIQHAILHLSYAHNFRLLANEGSESPPRGTMVELSSRQALLHLGGKEDVPVQLRVDKRSSYSDMYAMAKQVLFFSHLSYRGFRPPNTPVTIKYPKLMARMMEQLERVSKWDPSVARGLNDKLWFI